MVGFGTGANPGEWLPEAAFHSCRPPPFGNAAELIIALAALHAGLHDVVKASIAGSIIGNILLVLGAAMLADGLRRREQHFNPAGARSQATMLTLVAIALILPAAFQAALGTRTARGWTS
jgi:Ca2+:H+ antiporter